LIRTKKPRCQEPKKKCKGPGFKERIHKNSKCQGLSSSGEPLEFLIWNFFGS
jgi:hypothetical protein